jgi:hypothetical protein
MIDLAQRDGSTRVAVVPVGFHYTRGPKWSVIARIGAPQFDPAADAIERSVRELSRA